MTQIERGVPEYRSKCRRKMAAKARERRSPATAGYTLCYLLNCCCLFCLIRAPAEEQESQTAI